MPCSWRAVLISTTTIWLLLTIARQVFDLIGRLWIPVIFNLLQVLCCIVGLFAVCQNRKSLLLTFAVSSLISTAYNVLLLVWYIGVFGDISSPVLSAGLPFSFSFFLKYTPTCPAHFDLKRSIWVQDSCPVEFYYIEAGQAGLHATIAIITLVSALVVACCSRKDQAKERRLSPVVLSSDALSSSSKQQKAAVGSSAPSSINEHSGGYVNATYEDASSSDYIDTQEIEDKPKPRTTYAQNSKRKRGRTPSSKGSVRQNTATPTGIQNSQNDDRWSEESREPAERLVDSQDSVFEKRVQSRSQSRVHRDDSDDNAHDKRARSRNRSRSRSEDVLDEETQSRSGYAEIMQTERSQRSSGRFIKASAQKRRSHQPIDDDTTESVDERSVQSTESSEGNDPHIHSLVSFDPKSANTLIRFREHKDPQSQLANEQKRLSDYYSKINKVPQFEKHNQRVSTIGIGLRRTHDPESDYEQISIYKKLGPPENEQTKSYNTDSLPSCHAPILPALLSPRGREGNFRGREESPRGRDGSSCDSGVASVGGSGSGVGSSTPSESWPQPPTQIRNSHVRVPQGRTIRDSWRVTQSQWEPTPSTSSGGWKSSEVLSQRDHLDSPLESSRSSARTVLPYSRSSSSSALETARSQSEFPSARSGFQVEQGTPRTAIGHYHSRDEIRLIPLTCPRLSMTRITSTILGDNDDVGIPLKKTPPSSAGASEVSFDSSGGYSSPGIRLDPSIKGSFLPDSSYSSQPQRKAPIIHDGSLLV